MDSDNPSPLTMSLDDYIKRALKRIDTARRGDRRQNPDSRTPPFATQDGIILVDRRSHVERRSARRS